MARKILIVDSNEMDRQLFATMLRKEYEVLEAETGEGATAILRMKGHVVSGVVMGTVRHNGDGYELLRRIRGHAIWSQIPVVVCIQKGEQEVMEKTLSLGANAVLEKPVNQLQLVYTLRNDIRLRETAAIVNALRRDKLTGVYNREAFFEMGGRMIKQQPAGYYIISCLNIDSFKIINDQYGTKAGDEVLRHVARCVGDYAQSVGGMCCRFMGDKFAVLFPAECKDSEELLATHHTAASPPCVSRGIKIRIGRYVINDLSLAISAMYDRACLAEETIKGRYDTYIAEYEEPMRDRLLHEQKIVTEMHDALRLGQFEPWFQPQYNHATGALVGAEALVRWVRPQDGRLMPPNVFIPVFERNGFVYEMDKCVWERVCFILRRWIDAGRSPLPVSVNISRYDLFREDFFEVITGLVEKYSLPIDLLRLEVTESAFAESTTQIVATIKRLIDYGFTVEIDDFGSGYSSLNTLKDVPATILKLDMRFLESTEDSQRGGNILESVVRMAKWLGMRVIAEGVETKQQADYLKSIGCFYIQGYLYARPMPLREYEELENSSTKESKMSALETVENLDNNAFWDPRSMDTLIFNSYVGGACIFEYHAGRAELLRANDNYIRALGVEHNEGESLSQLDPENYLDEENLDAVYGNIRVAIETGRESTCEVRMEGDSPHYLRCTVRVIAKTEDRFLVYCVVEDVTAQRLAEEKEREAEHKRLAAAEQLQVIMANINGGVTAMTAQEGRRRLLFANDEFYRQLGYTKQEFETELKSPDEHIHPDDRQSVHGDMEAALKNRSSFTLFYRVVRRDGSLRWMQSNVTVISLPGVDGPVLLTVANDITLRIEAERRAQEAAAQLQAILSNVNGGVSAATIVGGSLSYIFTNDEYFAMFGYTREQFNEELPRGIFDIVNKEDMPVYYSYIVRAIKTGEPARTEFRAQRRDGSEIWVHSNSSVCRISGIDEPVRIAVATDVTESRMVDEQLRLLNNMAHDLLAQPDTEAGIDGALNKLLEYFASDRAYIFEYDYKESSARNSYEVCAPGVTPQKDALQNIPLTTLEYWTQQLEREECVTIGDVSALPDDRLDKPALLAQDISSLVAMPLKREGALIGFIGVDNPRKRHSQAEDHKALGDYVAVMLTRRDLLAKIDSDNEAMTALMRDTPGGFMRLRVTPEGAIVPVYFNGGCLRMMDMDEAAYTALCGGDVFAAVHPGDVSILREALDAMQARGEATSARYRLRRGGDGYIWVVCFGRRTTGPGGETMLNVYYTEADQVDKAEQQRRELLENLPCGVGICEVKGDKAFMVYLNKRYRDYFHHPVGRRSASSVFDVIHPDDHQKLREAMRPALESGGEGGCVVRVRDGADSYMAFRVVGAAMQYRGSSNRIYVTFTPISNEELSSGEMLSVVLTTIMDSTTDIAFAKDKDLRYVCASRAVAELAGLHSPYDVIGKTDYELYGREYADSFREADLRLMSGGEPLIDVVETLPSNDGVLHYSSTSKYLLKDALGSVIGIYGAGRDITEYRDAFDRLRLLSNSLPGGIAAYLCTDGALSPGSVRITYFNDGFCRLFGYTREEYEKISSADPASLILPEDRGILGAQLRRLVADDTPISCVYRVKVKGGGFKWIDHKAESFGRSSGGVIVNALLTDVTRQHIDLEQLRISEEENRLAVRHSGNVICRYTVADRSISMSRETAERYAMPERLEDVPAAPVARGHVSPGSVKAYTAFFEEIIGGSASGEGVFQCKMPDGWRWQEAHYSTVFGENGQPVSAVLSFFDVTERLEKEAVYRSWQQSLASKSQNAYTLLRCSIGRDDPVDTVSGGLICMTSECSLLGFRQLTERYASQWVHPEDREQYTGLLSADSLITEFYRAERFKKLEFRELLIPGGDAQEDYRWLRLSLELFQREGSDDVEAFLMYENIDEAKREQLATRLRAETDPLTGLLNRKTFAEKMQALMDGRKNGAIYALLMLDLDGFKKINDSFGHDFGDETFREVSRILSAELDEGDLAGRLGGDEFTVCISDAPSRAYIGRRAKRLCGLLRKAYSMEVQLSASIGIAVSPGDGADFETLYHKSDLALYHVKATGKDNFAFYSDSMRDEAPRSDEALPAQESGAKRRMLVVEDNQMGRDILVNLFKDEFIVDTANDGDAGLVRLSRYGAGFSVVLLDLVMPEMDGFTVLEKIRQSPELQGVPVVVVSAMDERETSLRAIRDGASDFVTKPVDPDLLRLRVHSAISKAENERLRAENRFLALRSEEVARYRAVLDSDGTALVELDMPGGKYSCDGALSMHLAGSFDHRPLLTILAEDEVADSRGVARLKELLGKVAEDGSAGSGSIKLPLRAPSGQRHSFLVRAIRRTEDGQRPVRLLLTFTDTES